MFVCMYVCMYACMHVCMYACMYACMHVCMHACMYVCMCIVINCIAAHLTNFSSNKLHNCQNHLSGYYVQVYLTEL